MKIKDLKTKKNDKALFKISYMERNPNNNLFLIIGHHYLKIQKLNDDNEFTEGKIPIPKGHKLIKYATWGRITNNILYYFDSNNNNLHTLNLSSNDNANTLYKFEYNIDISHLSINCNDSTMALCAKDHKIYLFDIKNKKIKSQITRNNNWIIYDCQFSPINENYLLISGDGGNIYLYDIRNDSKPASTFDSEAKEILSVSWHPSNKNLFCSGGMDNFIRIWDITDSEKPKAEFKTTEGCSRVNYLKSNSNYIMSVYHNINYDINLWNVKMSDMPEYRFKGHESNIIGLDTDIIGTRIVSVDKKGILIVHDINKGERILEDISTNIIKINNNNEIYCFHEEKMKKEIFSKIIHKDSDNKINDEKPKINIKHGPKNNIKENINCGDPVQENINKIFMLNFNQKDLQIVNKSPTKEDRLIHLKKDTVLILNNELKQYYFFTPEQIKSLFRGYIYYIEQNENLYKRKRFQSVNDLFALEKNIDSEKEDELTFDQKLNISISKNLLYALKHIKNYNHISVWKTLLNLSEKSTFNYIYNKFIGKEIKNKKSNNLNKSFEKEKSYYEMRQKNMTSSDIKLMAKLIIRQLSKIIEYLIDDYGDIYLATIICYLFKPILFQDEKIKKRCLKLIIECVYNLRKYQLYVEANHLIKYGPEENNNLDDKNYIFNYSCLNCKKNKFKNSKCSCGRIIACKECGKIISGLLLWYPSCGHEEHFSHSNKNKNEFYCNDCKKIIIKK